MVKTINTLQDLCDALQSLCHEGYAQYEILTDVRGVSTGIITGITTIEKDERIFLNVNI